MIVTTCSVSCFYSIKTNFYNTKLIKATKLAIFKILNSKTQLEQKSNSNDQKPRFKAVKENIKLKKLKKDIKSSPRKKKVITEKKSIFIVGDSMTKDLVEKGNFGSP